MQRLLSDTVPGTSGVHLDTDTVRQVLARASEIEQQKDPETLTVEQVETLGRELGISPEAVRRALGEVAPNTNQQLVHIPRSKRLQQSNYKAALQPVLRFSGLNAAVLFVYMCTAIANSNFLRSQNIMESPAKHNVLFSMIMGLALTFIVAAPVLISMTSGWHSRHIRTGMLGGLVLGIASVLSTSVVAIPFNLLVTSEGNFGLYNPIWGFVMAMPIACTFFGGIGGVAWRWWNSLAKHEER